MFSLANSALWMQCIGEMVGTMLLVLLGNGACFAVSHRKMFANQSGRWVIVAFGWALAIFIGAFAAQALGSPGHINPAISIYASFDNWKLLAFIPMQVLGAIIGQFLLYAMNWNFIKYEAEDGDSAATRGSSCTNPAFEKKYFSNSLYEFVGTAVLIMVVFLLSQGYASFGTLNTFVVSTAILSIAMSLGSATGFALNPARDFGPRLAYQVLRLTPTGKSLVDANWSYSFVPVLAPCLAGVMFGLISLAL